MRNCNDRLRAFSGAAIALLMGTLPLACRAATCAFPADAVTGPGQYVSGPTEAAAASRYAIVHDGYSGRGFQSAPTGKRFTVLAMYPPTVWQPQVRAAVIAAFHAKWPRVPASNLYVLTPMDRGGPFWLAKIRDDVGVKWIASNQFINAPALGGLLAFGPTACDVEIGK